MDTEKKAVNKLEIIRKIINIMKVLQEETDEQHTISQSGLQEALKNKDCVCSTRSLTDYLKTIMLELNPEDVDGYVEDNATIEHYVITVRGLEDKLQARDDGLEREGSKILQLRDLRYNHLFTFDELNQIIEGALFLKHIDDESKVKIINKLKTLSSKKFADYSPYISKNTEQIDMNITGVFEDSRVDDVALRNNIQFIRTAIEKDNGAGCKIAFNGYDENKKLKPRCDAKGNKIRYVASPYYIIMYNGKPYLVCVVEPHKDVSIYRIDLMSNITTQIKPSVVKKGELEEEAREAKFRVTGLPIEWNSKEACKFQTEHLYMYYGEPRCITFKLHNGRYTLLHDYFGDHYKFIKHIDDTWDCVEVKCVPEAMISWAMQCSDFVEVLEPKDLRSQIEKKCKELAERYANKK